MIHRIVKMHFQPDKIEEFLGIFNESAHLINQAPGCLSLVLLRDIYHQNTFFTFSVWENEQALNAYRESPLFNNTWEKTKKLFAGKPDAWSTEIA